MADEKYLTIPRIARKCGVSDNTVRRYLRNYAAFFPASRIINHWEQYPAEETENVVRKINEIARAGKRKHEVMEKLEAAGFRIYEIEAIPESSERDCDTAKALCRIADSLREITVLLKELVRRDGK